jgi:Pvc16 N-terminal domain
MSNYLAIATVTAALQRLLQDGIREDVPGATVTTVRPDNSGAASQVVGVNIYLYQASPNPAWRNADLRTRRPKGDLIKHGQAGLDLSYLLTFYGNEQELEPQRLLGSTIRTLVDQPTLTQEMIQETIEQPNFPYLADSTLSDQVQLVQFIPSTLTADELSRIWSIFFQVPYSLSFAFQGTAILIQGGKPGKISLPVRRRQFYIASGRPVIDKVEVVKPRQLEETATDNGQVEPLTCSSPLMIVIKGRNLWSDRTIVRLGRAEITPQKVTENEVHVQLSLLRAEEARSLRSGVQGVQVVHQFQKQPAGSGYSAGSDYEVESNVMPLVLCPDIVDSGVTLLNAEEQDENIYRGAIEVRVDVNVASEQRSFLLLNGMENTENYIFRAARRTAETQTISFPIQEVAAGQYLVRVQIDGAESPLQVDANEQYAEPSVAIP